MNWGKKNSPMRSTLNVGGLSLLTALGLTAGATCAVASSATINLEVSEGKLLALKGTASNVFIADPTIADVQVPVPNRLFIFGKAPGHTTLFALDSSGATIASYSVDVVIGTTAATKALTSDPNSPADLKIRPAGDSMVVSGTYSDPLKASLGHDEAVLAVKDKSHLSDQSVVQGSVQVNLRVRVAEVSRSIVKTLGFNWNALFTVGSGFGFGVQTGRGSGAASFSSLCCGNGGSLTFTGAGNGTGLYGAGYNGGSAQIGAVIDALATEGYVTLLAEPNLTALSGEPANFLAGGEFPVPISFTTAGAGAASAPTIGIEFKQYGVSLSFVPTVLASNRINLRVRPEVSELSNQGSVTENGFNIPGILVRRAETTIELGSGESFAIGGLLQNNVQSQVDSTPGLTDLPVLGALFRSSTFQRNESELVIIVTPYIVRPVDDPTALKTPLDGFRAASDLEELIAGHVVSPNVSLSEPAAGPRLNGDAGFELQ
jgi:pilus assembly protein CpaC